MRLFSPFHLLFLLSFLFLNTCAPQEKEENEKKEGIYLLSRGDFSTAIHRLEPLLLKNPEDQEIHFLLGLAYFGDGLDKIHFAITLGISFLTDIQAISQFLTEEDRVTDENQYVLELLRGIVSTFSEPFQKAVTHLLFVKDPRIRIPFSSLKFYLFNVPFIEITGDLKKGDALLLAFLANLLSTPFRWIVAYNLQFDFYKLLHFVVGDQASRYLTSPGIANVLVQLLSDQNYPSFLALNHTDENRNGIPDGKETLSLLKDQWKETSEGLKRVLEGKEPLGAGKVERNEEEIVLTFQRVFLTEEGEFPFDVRIRKEPAPLIPPGKYQPLSIVFPSSVTIALSDLRENLSGKEGRPLITPEDHLYPLLLPWIVEILSRVDFLPSTIKTLLKPFQGNGIGLSAGLHEFLPPYFLLDLYPFLSEPKGLREFFPVFRTDLSPEENNFLFEWECGEFLPTPSSPTGSTSVFPQNSILCGENSPLTDKPHFQDPIFSSFGIPPIEKDGIPSRLPYLPFPDPTFGNLLYFEEDRFVENGRRGISPGDLRSLNGYIALVGRKILSLF